MLDKRRERKTLKDITTKNREAWETTKKGELYISIALFSDGQLFNMQSKYYFVHSHKKCKMNFSISWRAIS